MSRLHYERTSTRSRDDGTWRVLERLPSPSLGPRCQSLNLKQIREEHSNREQYLLIILTVMLIYTLTLPHSYTTFYILIQENSAFSEWQLNCALLSWRCLLFSLFYSKYIMGNCARKWWFEHGSFPLAFSYIHGRQVRWAFDSCVLIMSSSIMKPDNFGKNQCKCWRFVFTIHEY